MAATPQLKDIIEALEMQIDEHSSFLDLDTGEVETVSDQLLHHAEDSPDGEEPDDLLIWQEEEWEIAKRIASTDRFIQLPTKFDVHEWEIMRDFSETVKSAKIRDELSHAIHGAGAFRHFKATVRRLGIEPAWFDFRAEAMKQIAIDWCEEHDIAWK